MAKSSDDESVDSKEAEEINNIIRKHRDLHHIKLADEKKIGEELESAIKSFGGKKKSMEDDTEKLFLKMKETPDHESVTKIHKSRNSRMQPDDIPELEARAMQKLEALLKQKGSVSKRKGKGGEGKDSAGSEDWINRPWSPKDFQKRMEEVSKLDKEIGKSERLAIMKKYEKIGGGKPRGKGEPDLWKTSSSSSSSVEEELDKIGTGFKYSIPSDFDKEMDESNAMIERSMRKSEEMMKEFGKDLPPGLKYEDFDLSSDSSEERLINRRTGRRRGGSPSAKSSPKKESSSKALLSTRPSLSTKAGGSTLKPLPKAGLPKLEKMAKKPLEGRQPQPPSKMLDRMKLLRLDDNVTPARPGTSKEGNRARTDPPRRALGKLEASDSLEKNKPRRLAGAGDLSLGKDSLGKGYSLVREVMERSKIRPPGLENLQRIQKESKLLKEKDDAATKNLLSKVSKNALREKQTKFSRSERDIPTSNLRADLETALSKAADGRVSFSRSSPSPRGKEPKGEAASKKTAPKPWKPPLKSNDETYSGLVKYDY